MPGLIRGVARTAVVAGTASAVAGNVQHRQQKKWSEKDQAQQYQEIGQQQVAAQQAAPAQPQNDAVAELQKLAQLKDQGILTEEEFAAKKKQVLGI